MDTLSTYSKIGIAIIIVLSVLLLYLISLAIGASVFNSTIDTTYSQYELNSEGNFIKEVDCVGNTIYSIGKSIIKNNTYTSSLYTKVGARDALRGGDCEYKLYKGWHWGIGDFYYITAK
jgi:hypothetical protein